MNAQSIAKLKNKLTPQVQELPGKTGLWLLKEGNEEARALTDTWVDMYSAGEPVVGSKAVHEILVQEYGFPYKNAQSFSVWIRSRIVSVTNSGGDR